jgi:hypothetical protein
MRIVWWIFAVIAAILFASGWILLALVAGGDDDALIPMMACSTAWIIFGGIAFWGFYSGRRVQGSSGPLD